MESMYVLCFLVRNTAIFEKRGHPTHIHTYNCYTLEVASRLPVSRILIFIAGTGLSG